MKFEKIKCGVVTVLVDVGGTAPLSLTGTIIAELPRHHDDTIVFPKKIEVVGNVGVEGEITTETELLILRVSAATIPTGFPLTIAQLLTDVAINMDAIILILPVTVV